MAYTIEQKFGALCQITRAAHFEWRKAFREMYPDADTMEMVLKYWEVVGHDTAKAYLKRIDRTKPIINQLAEMIVDSSLAMGEEAVFVNGEKADEVYFEHLGCPWLKWHQRYDAVEEDQPGCDKWIQTIIDDFNKELGTAIEFETLSSLPAGNKTCKRVLKQK